MRVVADASVALKWFFRDRGSEGDTEAALDLLDGVRSGDVELLQPPHFVAEVAAVLARELPQAARANLNDLLDIEMQVVEDAAVYARALALAIRHRQHVFDTLYHAIALEDAATLVTADDRYFHRARSEGRVLRLAEFARPA